MFGGKRKGDEFFSKGLMIPIEILLIIVVTFILISLIMKLLGIKIF